ncbi:MAG TPA: chemotaxis protein CheX [Bryobacteraceae bacterium]|nr:chemotaxis protein CheX [Bryobacteraceae bacterium]
MDQDAAVGETVRAVAAEVFETMFFTEAEPAACEHAWLLRAPCARIRFDGSHTGEMLLALSAEAADPIAAAFLGLDPAELTEGPRRQVIEEMSNILCGAMLSRLWPESTLALAAPQSVGWEEWAPAGTLHLCFQIPEGMVAVSLRLTAVK